jgi:rubredoxin
MSHCHRCTVCGHIFSHTRNPNWSYEENEQAHTCPVCSSGPFYSMCNEQGLPYVALPPSAVIAASVMLCMLRDMILECDEYSGNGFAL